MLECTIVMPLYILLALAVTEFGRFSANRSQIQSALRQAGEHAATRDVDCLDSARDRFFEAMVVLKSGAELAFVGEVVPFAGDALAIRLTVTGDEPTLLPNLTIPVSAVGVFLIEIPGGCLDRFRLESTSSDAARARRPSS